jgi:hypothetical protein
MSLPDVLQNIIISFTHNSDYLVSAVCKHWKSEIIKNKQKAVKKAVDVISNWYYRRRIPMYYITKTQMIRSYVVGYSDHRFITHPEWVVDRLNLNYFLLDDLPPLLGRKRKRSHVRDWLLSLPVDLEDWFLY